MKIRQLMDMIYKEQDLKKVFFPVFYSSILEVFMFSAKIFAD